MPKYAVTVCLVLLALSLAEAAAPPPTGVFGRCAKVIHPGSPRAKTTRAPLAEVKVTAHAGGQVVAEAASDAEGLFRLRIPPGKYRISFAPPKGIESQQPDINIELRAGARKEIAAEFHINLR